jgi:ATP-dependent DNA ligase
MRTVIPLHVEPMLAGPQPELPNADRIVLDGELVIVGENGLDFEALQLRIHPAQSRVRLLAVSTPVTCVAFDLLAAGTEDFRDLPLGVRRERLQELLAGAEGQILLTPITRDPVVAAQWFEHFEGAGLDGVIAKKWSQKYLPGKRAWVKVKHQRTTDCIVIGFRWSNDRQSLGSLLLGLYDENGTLHYVGHTSSFDAATRRRLLKQLKLMRIEPSPAMRAVCPAGRGAGRRAGRRIGKRSALSSCARSPSTSCRERCRHATGFVRWWTDKPPEQCTFDQIASAARFDVAEIFGGR